MFILSRRVGESLLIGDNVKISVCSIQGRQVNLGVTVPDDSSVFREEVYLRVKDENRQAMLAGMNDLFAAAALWQSPKEK